MVVRLNKFHCNSNNVNLICINPLIILDNIHLPREISFLQKKILFIVSTHFFFFFWKTWVRFSFSFSVILQTHTQVVISPALQLFNDRVQTRVLCASSASRRSFSKHTIGNENKKKRKVKKKSLKVAIHPIFFFFF
jgi:hypothetical protein